MQTTGPFTPVAGVLLTEYDPAKYTTASVAVQVQNNSGFALVATISGRSYFIPPFSATTVPTYTAPQLMMVPASTISLNQGSIILLWFQSGDQSPVRDGPLSTSIPATQLIGAFSASTTVNINLNANSQLTFNAVFVSSAPAGFVGILYNFSIYLGWDGSLSADYGNPGYTITTDPGGVLVMQSTTTPNGASGDLTTIQAQSQNLNASALLLSFTVKNPNSVAGTWPVTYTYRQDYVPV